jgi:hypothetical protein
LKVLSSAFRALAVSVSSAIRSRGVGPTEPSSQGVHVSDTEMAGVL